MTEPADHASNQEDFSLDSISKRCRAGSLPPGYLDAYGKHLRGQCEGLRRRIEADLASVSGAEDWTF